MFSLEVKQLGYIHSKFIYSFLEKYISTARLFTTVRVTFLLGFGSVRSTAGPSGGLAASLDDDSSFLLEGKVRIEKGFVRSVNYYPTRIVDEGDEVKLT